jgi:hypothetical protein
MISHFVVVIGVIGLNLSDRMTLKIRKIFQAAPETALRNGLKDSSL